MWLLRSVVSVTCSEGSYWQGWTGWRNKDPDCGWSQHYLQPAIAQPLGSPPQTPATEERSRAAGGGRLQNASEKWSKSGMRRECWLVFTSLSRGEEKLTEYEGRIGSLGKVRKVKPLNHVWGHRLSCDSPGVICQHHIKRTWYIYIHFTENDFNAARDFSI